MSKKIVMVGNTSWGMFQFRGDLMRCFLSQGIQVVVVAPEDEYSHQIIKLGAKLVPVPVERKGTNPFSDLAYTVRLLKAFVQEKPDIVLCYTIKPILYGILSAKLANVPIRMAITTGLGNAFSSENWVNKIIKLLYKFSLKFASEVWFLNQEDAGIFIRNNLVPANKTFVLPGEGVDVDHYSPGVPSRVERFTLISRMLWDKGVGIFVECARELKKQYPNILFRLVGPIDLDNPEGIQPSQLDEWSKEGIVEYYGQTDNIKTVLGETSCLVHPTYYKEGLPRVLMEACSMGIPCITTNIPGCKDVIFNGKNGFLVSEKSTEELKQAIVSYIALGYEKKLALSREARRTMVENFSSQFIHSIYLQKLSLVSSIS